MPNPVISSTAHPRHTRRAWRGGVGLPAVLLLVLPILGAALPSLGRAQDTAWVAVDTYNIRASAELTEVLVNTWLRGGGPTCAYAHIEVGEVGNKTYWAVDSLTPTERITDCGQAQGFIQYIRGVFDRREREPIIRGILAQHPSWGFGIDMFAVDQFSETLIVPRLLVVVRVKPTPYPHGQQS